MKKLSKPLALRTETIRNLQSSDLAHAVGGSGTTVPTSIIRPSAGQSITTGTTIIAPTTGQSGTTSGTTIISGGGH